MSEDINNTQTGAENQEGQETQDTQDVNNTVKEGQQTETQDNKTFSQEDVDKLIGERLKRERSKMPAKEDLEAFKEWKKSQQTEQERLAEERKQFEALQGELTQLKNEKAVLKSGVSSDYADFVSFKVGQMEGDFEDNLDSFLKDNPQYSKSANNTTPTTPAGGQKIKNEVGKINDDDLSDEEYFKKHFKK